MNAPEIAVLLKERFGDRVLETKNDGHLPFSVVSPPSIQEICAFMKTEDSLSFVHLENLAGVDYKDRIEVVYTMYSMKHKHRYTLKCKLPRVDPKLPTVETVWGVANWHEREAFDMFGIVFEGHSDMRRILCPDDWEGWPLRKDYKTPTSYRDMPV